MASIQEHRRDSPLGNRKWVAGKLAWCLALLLVVLGLQACQSRDEPFDRIYYEHLASGPAVWNEWFGLQGYNSETGALRPLRECGEDCETYRAIRRSKLDQAENTLTEHLAELRNQEPDIDLPELLSDDLHFDCTGEADDWVCTKRTRHFGHSVFYWVPEAGDVYSEVEWRVAWSPASSSTEAPHVTVNDLPNGVLHD